MSALQWYSRPRLHQPVMIVAFEGWNDAGDAASMALGHLAECWDADVFATIDPEEFYDFTATRPQIRIEGGVTRHIDWPSNEFLLARPPGSPDIVLLAGVEPQLKWRSFSSLVVEVARSLGCRLVLTLGALLADVAHTRPTSVFGNAYEQSVIDALGLEASRYEGPTGIVGVIHAECAAAGLNSASLWAAVPSYVPSAPSPKAALALVSRACDLLNTSVPVDELVVAAADYEDQITHLVSEDDESLAYVRHLEEQHDREDLAVHTADDLVDEVERFLRDQ